MSSHEMQKSDYIQKFVNKKLKKKKGENSEEKKQLLDEDHEDHSTDSSCCQDSKMRIKKRTKSKIESSGLDTDSSVDGHVTDKEPLTKTGTQKYGTTEEAVRLDSIKKLVAYENEKKKSMKTLHHHSNHHHGNHRHGNHHHGDHKDLKNGDYSGDESEHCHDSSDERSILDEKKRRKAMKKLLIATALSCVFMIGEVIGGYLANSLAIMTDASHLLTDVSSFLISIIALKMASRPISTKMTFGWHRAEVIGALISVLAIWVVTGILVYLAIKRVITDDYQVQGKTMLITASVAVAFNILQGLVLHEHGHSHGHSHDHDHDHETGSTSSGHDEESGNVNVRAAFIHVIGDLLQSLGVLTAAFIIYFKPEYKIADPVCTFLFSVLVLITTFAILRDTMIVIMEGSPVGVKYNVVNEKLLEIPGVTAVHDLRIWSLTLNQAVMSAHLAIDKHTDQNIVLKRATRRLKALYDFHSLTIQVEYYSEDMNDCKKCKPAT